MSKSVSVSARLILIIAISLMALGFSACGSDEGPGVTFTSTQVNSHAHTVVIPEKDYQNAPDGKLYTTSKGTDGHTHQIKVWNVDFINARRHIDTTNRTNPPSNGKDEHIHVFNLKH